MMNEYPCFLMILFPDKEDTDSRALARLQELTEDEVRTVACEVMKSLASSSEPGQTPLVFTLPESNVRDDLPRLQELIRESRLEDEVFLMTLEDVLGDPLYLAAKTAAEVAHRILWNRKPREVSTFPKRFKVEELSDASPLSGVRQKWFETSNMQCWGPVYGGGIPNSERTPLGALFYDDDARAWMLVSDRPSFTGDKSARILCRLDEADAAEWLVTHRFGLPDKLSHLAAEVTVQPDPAPTTSQTLKPDEDDWSFPQGMYIYRGHEFPLRGKKWLLLKLLARHSIPQGMRDIKDELWPDDNLVEDSTVRKHLSELRRELRAHLQLPDAFNPIPQVDRGALAAWTLAPNLGCVTGLADEGNSGA